VVGKTIRALLSPYLGFFLIPYCAGETTYLRRHHLHNIIFRAALNSEKVDLQSAPTTFRAVFPLDW
jgi:hypothetical protein